MLSSTLATITAIKTTDTTDIDVSNMPPPYNPVLFRQDGQHPRIPSKKTPAQWAEYFGWSDLAPLQLTERSPANALNETEYTEYTEYKEEEDPQPLPITRMAAGTNCGRLYCMIGTVCIHNPTDGGFPELEPQIDSIDSDDDFQSYPSSTFIYERKRDSALIVDGRDRDQYIEDACERETEDLRERETEDACERETEDAKRDTSSSLPRVDAFLANNHVFGSWWQTLYKNAHI